ncbi:MAG: amino acid-binding protein [Bacteroidales bacterium]|nr:amino acid-binding protein [Bacteroidales bacterium]
MIIHQLSVFLENKAGRLTEVLDALGKEHIKITALSIADTSEFGILRMLVSDPDKSRQILKERSFTVNITEVISIMTPNEAQYYAKALKILSDLDISIEYTYAFSIGQKSIVVMRCSNNELAIKALKEHEMELVRASDLYKI